LTNQPDFFRSDGLALQFVGWRRQSVGGEPDGRREGNAGGTKGQAGCRARSGTNLEAFAVVLDLGLG